MMRNSLLIKLLGAFLLVILIGGAVIALLTSNATENAFSLYSSKSGQVWAERLAPVLADFYQQENSWAGVEAVLQSEVSSQYAPMGSGMMSGQGNGRNNNTGRQTGNSAMMPSDQRLILADASGTVISDSQNQLNGQSLSTSELQNGVAILVNNKTVGTLIITLNEIIGTSSPAGEFLSAVNQAILSSALIAGAIAILLGTLLFFQIISPLRQLRKAAQAISEGDLNQRVNIRTRDEFGELGETFNKMANNLSEAEIHRQHMMADVAHELRTPLSAIQGTLEGMQDGVLPVDQEQLSALHEETLLLNRLINDLRELSLAESGHLVLTLVETDIQSLIQKIVERIQPQADIKNIQVRLNIVNKIPPFSIDPDRITQVVNNLLSNSLRYTSSGGEITIKTEYQAAEKKLKISVEDTGMGIDPESLPHVFDRFYRSDKSRSRASGGSGLGLAIVRQLVEAHGGTIEAVSPIYFDTAGNGSGTRMTFSLPISRFQNNK